MFLMNGVDIAVVITVIILVLLVIFLRFILPKLGARKVGGSKNDRCSKCR